MEFWASGDFVKGEGKEFGFVFVSGDFLVVAFWESLVAASKFISFCLANSIEAPDY